MAQFIQKRAPHTRRLNLHSPAAPKTYAPSADVEVSGLFRGDAPLKVVGRYALFSQIARGGMGTVHLGRLVASAGFERVVAIKRVHPELMIEREFLGMFRDEIRIAARVQHPNVVSALDVVEDDRELWLVMEYVHGAPLAQLQKLTGGRGISPRVVAAILVGVLQGLHAAHERVRGACDHDWKCGGLRHRSGDRLLCASLRRGISYRVVGDARRDYDCGVERYQRNHFEQRGDHLSGAHGKLGHGGRILRVRRIDGRKPFVARCAVTVSCHQQW